MASKFPRCQSDQAPMGCAWLILIHGSPTQPTEIKGYTANHSTVLGAFASVPWCVKSDPWQIGLGSTDVWSNGDLGTFQARPMLWAIFPETILSSFWNVERVHCPTGAATAIVERHCHEGGTFSPTEFWVCDACQVVFTAVTRICKHGLHKLVCARCGGPCNCNWK